MFSPKDSLPTTRLARAVSVFAAITVAAVLIAAITMLLAPANVSAKKDSTKTKAHAKGTITALNTGTGTVTIQDTKSSQAVTVTVALITHLRLDRKKATLADLVVGDQANTRFNKQTHVAKRLFAKSPKLQGTITAVNASAHTVSIQAGQNAPVTLTVSSATKLRLNHKKAALADLVVGDSAKAKYNPQTMQASKLQVKNH